MGRMLTERGNQMKFKQFAVYQLPFENHHSRDISFMSQKEVEAITDHFEMVAVIEAHTRDHAFYISNSSSEEPGLESLINRITPKMHSMSVGDIVHDLETGECFLVRPVGWAKITMKEYA